MPQERTSDDWQAWETWGDFYSLRRMPTETLFSQVPTFRNGACSTHLVRPFISPIMIVIGDC